MLEEEAVTEEGTDAGMDVAAVAAVDKLAAAIAAAAAADPSGGSALVNDRRSELRFAAADEAVDNTPATAGNVPPLISDADIMSCE